MPSCISHILSCQEPTKIYLIRLTLLWLCQMHSKWVFLAWFGCLRPLFKCHITHFIRDLSFGVRVASFKRLSFETILTGSYLWRLVDIHLRYLSAFKWEIVKLLLNLKPPCQMLQKTWHVSFLPEDPVPRTLDWQAV